MCIACLCWHVAEARVVSWIPNTLGPIVGTQVGFASANSIESVLSAQALVEVAVLPSGWYEVPEYLLCKYLSYQVACMGNIQVNMCQLYV